MATVTVPEVYTVDDLLAVLELLDKNIVAAMRAQQDWVLRTLAIEALNDYCSYARPASRRALGTALIGSLHRQAGDGWRDLTGDAAQGVVRWARDTTKRTWR